MKLSALSALLFFIAPGVGATDNTQQVFYTAGCSVLQSASGKPINIGAAAVAAAKELGLEDFHGDFRSSATGRVVSVADGDEPGTYFVESATPNESDVSDARRDAVIFAEHLVHQFPPGVLSRPMKICGFGPGV